MALIPIDVALGGINSIRGLIGANEADRERRRQLEQAAAQRRMAIDALAKQSNDAFQEYQRRLQAGEFDATKALDLIGRTSAENLRTGLGNQLTSLRNLGYKAGDTPIEMGTKAMTSDALLREQAQRLAAQQQFEDRQQQALGYLDQVRAREASARMGLGGQMQEEGMRMPGNNLDTFMQNLIGGGFAKRLEEEYFKKPKPKTTAGYNPPAPSQAPFGSQMNWQREIKKFTGKDSTVWDSKHYYGKLNNQFHIVHYDAVAKVAAELRKQEFDLLVCDEATYLKNRQTIRAKSVLGSYKERRKYPGIKTKYCLFLTGTPVMSRPIEAFALLNFLDKDRFNNFFHFTQRYGGWKGDAPRNLQDLHDRTKDLVIRRKKEQILTELPAKQRNDLYVELTKDEQKQYKELLREVFGKWKIEKPSIGHMPKLQGFLIEKKMPRLVEMIDEFLDNDKPILIFSNYIAPIKFLEEHYGQKSAILTGEMNSKERQKSIDRLTSGEAKVGLFSLLAAGMGIDGLQKQIDTVVFLNCDWVPANHEQAEDRTHRIGQKSQVQVYYMLCADTIDEYMRDILKEKQQVADLVVDGALVTPERSKSYFKEFVSKISQVYKEDISTKNIDD